MPSLEEKLSVAEHKLTALMSKDVVEELEKQSEKRTRVAITFLLAVVADWILSFVIPILQGKAPLTLEAVVISFILIFFYGLFVLINKYHRKVDMDTVKDWIVLSNQLDSDAINKTKNEELAKLEVDQRKKEIALRDEIVRDITKKGSAMFNPQGSSPAQRSDWTPMTESFTKMIRDINTQLIHREMQEHALVLLEEKLPAIRKSIEVLVEHIETMEGREEKRDEILFQLSADIKVLQAKIVNLEKRKS